MIEPNSLQPAVDDLLTDYVPGTGWDELLDGDGRVRIYMDDPQPANDTPRPPRRDDTPPRRPRGARVRAQGEIRKGKFSLRRWPRLRYACRQGLAC